MSTPAQLNSNDRFSEEEWKLRVDLAAAYRLVAMFGWDDLVFTHISAKLPGTEHFLINPYGSMFEEITASRLVRIDIHGNKLDDSEADVNPAGFTIHSCIHASRPDAMCVMHCHSINGVAVSTRPEGLLPISQFAMTVLPSLGYHDYEGFALTEGEKVTLVRDLGQARHLMLRNHGLLTVGPSVADAFLAMHRFEAACMVQVRSLAGGAPIAIPDAVQLTTAAQLGQVRGKAGAQRVWPGLLRRLNRIHPGYDA